MKKIIHFLLVILCFFPLALYANSPSSTVNWNASSGKTDCPNTTSHGSTHIWVIRTSNGSVAQNGSNPCNTHLNYAWEDVVWPFRNKNQHYVCPNNMRAVSLQRYNWATAVPNGSPWNRYRITCRSWDDTNPTLTRWWNAVHNVWSNVDRTTSASCNDVGKNGSSSVGSWCGTIQRRLSTSNFACNDSTTSGWTNNSSTNHSTPNGTVLQQYVCYRVKDRAGNGFIYTPIVRVKIDKQNPTISVAISGWTTTNNTWTNQNVTTTATCSDGSGSGCGTIQKRIQSTPTACNNTGTWTNGASHNHTTPNNTVKVEYACYRVRDNVNNGYVYSPVRTIKIDKEIPALVDVTNPNAANIYANNAYTYGINISTSGWSPIVSMRYRRENAANNAWSSNITDSSSPWSFTWDISRVDNYRDSNGGRLYTFNLNRICDEAWNCSTWSNNYNHYVFANSVNLGTTNVTSNALTNSTNVADGSAKNIAILLEDTYGNKIIPATGINRTIDFNISMNNNLRLDQYNNTATGNDVSAVYAGSTSNEVRVWSSQWPENQAAFNGINSASSLYNSWTNSYTIPFYVYAPTNSEYNLVTGSASMNSIHFDVNDSISTDSANSISNSNFNLRYRPKYYGEFSGDIVSRWFIEGAEQVSNYAIGTNPGTNGSSPSIRFEFGAVSGSNNVSNPRYNLDAGTSTATMNTLNEGQQSNWSTISTFRNSIASSSVSTLMQLQWWAVNEETYSYLASILEYTIWGKQVVYPSGIVWKTSYHGTALAWDNSYQQWVKILGNTATDSSQEIVTDQFTDDVRIFGTITKSLLRKQIEENAYSVIRNIPAKTNTNFVLTSSELNTATWSASKFDTGNSSSRWEAIYNDEVLYFGNMWGQTVRITNASNISGVKTLVVEDGNLIIDGNILDPNGDALLWIIVLGWDIFIDTDVTDIHAILYTNRSIRSDKGWSPYDGADLRASDLQNQLYIKWSIFSENTLWWSRKSPAECPYYITGTACSSAQEAQVYDLNYLRRYYIYNADTDSDGIGDTPTRSGTWAAWANATTDAYPVIIDYNSKVQDTPPPFFE